MLLKAAITQRRAGQPWYFWIGVFWEAALDLWCVLFPMRFSIVVLLLGTALLYFVSQAQDAITVVVGDAHNCYLAYRRWGLLQIGRSRVPPGLPARPDALFRLAILWASTLFWAFNSFYGARLASRLPPRGRVAAILALKQGCPSPAHIYTPPLIQAAWIKGFNRALPHVLGAGVVLGVNAAVLRAAGKIGPHTQLAMALSGVLQFCLVVWFLSHRRAVMGAIARRLGNPSVLRVGAAFKRDLAPRYILPPGWRLVMLGAISAAFGLFLASAFLPLQVDPRWVVLASALGVGLAMVAIVHSHVPDSTKLTIAVEVLCMAGLFALSLYPSSSIVPNLLGSPTVVILAGACWAFGGTFFFAIPAEVTGLPVLPALVALAVLFGCIGTRDNHIIRLAAPGPHALPAPFGQAASSPCVPLRPPPKNLAPQDKAKDTAFANAFARWCSVAAGHVPGDGPIPLVIVATAGGASRAAYWTEKILGELEARIPQFHDYVFAISSVSGGTLGSMAYRMSLDLPPPASVHRGTVGGADCVGTYHLHDDPEPCTLAMLQEDFLSALLLGGLYADLVQQTLPGAILPDRASALEKAWESGWARFFPSHKDMMQGGFLALANDFAPDQWRPLLLFNGTSVVTGQRVIVSNLPIGGDFPGAIDFFDSDGKDDFARINGAADIPVSAAVHLSARFPFLDAAADMAGEHGIADRVVDGGYFENYGAATAVDVLNHLITSGAYDFAHGRGGHAGRTIDPIIIQISNDPTVPPKGPLGAGTADASTELRPKFRILSDLTTPLAAFWDIRSGVGQRAIEVLRDRLAFLGPNGANDRRYFHFRITNKRVPMSWLLSDYAGRLIDDQLRLEKGCGSAGPGTDDNLSEFCNLVAIFPARR